MEFIKIRDEFPSEDTDDNRTMSNGMGPENSDRPVAMLNKAGTMNGNGIQPPIPKSPNIVSVNNNIRPTRNTNT